MDAVESNERARTSLRVASRVKQTSCGTNTSGSQNAIFRDFALTTEDSRNFGSAFAAIPRKT